VQSHTKGRVHKPDIHHVRNCEDTHDHPGTFNIITVVQVHIQLRGAKCFLVLVEFPEFFLRQDILIFRLQNEECTVVGRRELVIDAFLEIEHFTPGIIGGIFIRCHVDQRYKQKHRDRKGKYDQYP